VDGHLLPVYEDFFIAAHDGEGGTCSLTDDELRMWTARLRL
jgi:hypothetical protein